MSITTYSSISDIPKYYKNGGKGPAGLNGSAGSIGSSGSASSIGSTGSAGSASAPGSASTISPENDIDMDKRINDGLQKIENAIRKTAIKYANTDFKKFCQNKTKYDKVENFFQGNLKQGQEPTFAYEYDFPQASLPPGCQATINARANAKGGYSYTIKISLPPENSP